MYPCFGFWYQGISAKTTLLETTLCEPPSKGRLENKCCKSLWAFGSTMPMLITYLLVTYLVPPLSKPKHAITKCVLSVAWRCRFVVEEMFERKQKGGFVKGGFGNRVLVPVVLYRRSVFCTLFHSFLASVKRHLRGRHLSVLNLKFDFISDGGCTREEQIALSLKRHLFPHGGREPKAFWICFSRVHPPSEIKSNYKFKTLKRHLLKRHLTLSEFWGSRDHPPKPPSCEPPET